MRVRVQVIVEGDDETPSVVHEVAHIERGDLHIDTLGLHLAEAKDLLRKVQEVVIAEQVSSCFVNQVACPQCHQARVARTPPPSFCGPLRHAPPAQSALVHCSCQPQPTRTFSPLAAALPNARHPN